MCSLIWAWPKVLIIWTSTHKLGKNNGHCTFIYNVHHWMHQEIALQHQVPCTIEGIHNIFHIIWVILVESPPFWHSAIQPDPTVVRYALQEQKESSDSQMLNSNNVITRNNKESFSLILNIFRIVNSNQKCIHLCIKRVISSQWFFTLNDVIPLTKHQIYKENIVFNFAPLPIAAWWTRILIYSFNDRLMSFMPLQIQDSRYSRMDAVMKSMHQCTMNHK